MTILDTWTVRDRQDLAAAAATWKSPCMASFFLGIRRAAKLRSPILLLGEVGTEKEGAAHAIHVLSARRPGSFLAINCRAAPVRLFHAHPSPPPEDAALASQPNTADNEEALGRGTFFLDDIEALPARLQLRLIRLLKTQAALGPDEVSRDHPGPLVIAASKADPIMACQDGRLIEDLCFRLGAVQIRIPPLRERQADILQLAEAWLSRFGQELGRTHLTFTNAAAAALLAYHWPGNLRELENRVRQAALMAQWNTISPSLLGLEGPAQNVTRLGIKEALGQFHRQTIEKALAVHQGNVSAAALSLGTTRTTLYTWLRKLGIRREDFTSAEAAGLHPVSPPAFPPIPCPSDPTETDDEDFREPGHEPQPPAASSR